MLIDKNGRFLEVNNEYSSSIGYTSKELLSMSVKDLAVPGSNVNFDKLSHDIIDNGSRYFEMQQRAKDGIVITFGVDIQYLPSEEEFCVFMHDVSSQIRIEAKLKSTLKHLQFHVSNSPLATIEFDNNYAITQWSEKAEKLFGWKSDEVLGKRITDFKWVHEDDMEKVSSLSAEMFANKRTSNAHINRNYRKDGSVIICEWYNSAFIDSSGKLISVYSLVQDITERKRKEEEIISNKEQLEAAFNSMTDALYIADKKGMYINYNDAFLKFYNITSKDAAPKTLWESLEYLDISFSDGSEVPIDRWPTRRALNGESGLNEEFLLKRKDTGVAWIGSYNFAPVKDKNKNIIGSVVIARDITEQKRIETELKESIEKFKSIFKQSPIAIELFNSKGKLIDMNQTALELFGISELKFIEGFNLFDDPNLKEEAKQMLRNGQSVSIEMNFSFDLVRQKNLYNTSKSGYCYLDCYIVPWLSSGGKPNGYLIHLHDITERKRSEIQLEKYAEELKGLIQTKDKLFSIIAHDLRSPFSGLLNVTNMLIDQYSELTDEEKFSLINKLDSVANNSYKLLNNLLDWARLQTNKMEFEPESLNLAAELVPTIFLEMQLAQNKKIELEHLIDESICIKADRNMIATVIRNLISNAIKFTHPGGKIFVTAKRQEKFIKISVADTGIGINKEFMDKLFTVGTDKVTLGTANEHGTGLGLLLCKEMVEKHGGKIWAESELGKGTIFYFTVPSDEQSN